MNVTIPKKGLRTHRIAMAAIALTSLCSAASAGQLSFSAGSWTGLTGTAAGTPALIATESVSPIGGSITVRTTASGTQTLRGTLSFTVTWLPATVGETPPPNVRVTLKRAATPVVEGNGLAKVEAISALPPTMTELLKVDSTCLILSEITKYLADVVITAPLALQTDGTYKATTSVTSDLLTTTYNSQTSAVTKVTESFTLTGLEETN